MNQLRFNNRNFPYVANQVLVLRVAARVRRLITPSPLSQYYFREEESGELEQQIGLLCGRVWNDLQKILTPEFAAPTKMSLWRI